MIIRRLDLGQRRALLRRGSRKLDLLGDVGIFAQEGLGVLAALAEALAVIGEPGAGLLDDAVLDAVVEQFTRLGDTLADT